MSTTSYHGYGYHGGGRKKLEAGQRKEYVNLTISGSPEEIQRIKAAAKFANKSISRYVIETLKQQN